MPISNIIFCVTIHHATAAKLLRGLLMKVEVTVELDINLAKASIQDIKKLLEEMMNPKRFDALDAISIKDIKIG